MLIVINGEKTELPAPRTIAQLLAEQGFAGRAVAVEVNKKIVPRKLHADTTLRDGDQVEMVTLVGGG